MMRGILRWSSYQSSNNFRYNPLKYHGFSTITQLANSQEQFISRTRNIAIIAHVDHGKTTLVDAMLRRGGINLEQECAMDNNQLEREKGITILSKCTSILFNKHDINIVDTPGHHDFGGQVQRIMSMVDGVCLIVCATQGPMTQTKFVLKKALEQEVKPIVIINKIDRPTARTSEVINEIFQLFCDLNCPDHYIDYPIYYASGKNGWAVENLKDNRINIECLLKGIIQHVPQPKISPESRLSMLVTQTHPNQYFGKMILGRVNSGELEVGQELKTYDQQGNKIDTGKVIKIIKKTGLSQIELEKAFAGDIVSIAGFPNTRVTHTIVEEGYPSKTIRCIKIDKPLMGVSVIVNNSPLAGREGSKVSLNELKNRIKLEVENDVALEVYMGNKNSNTITVRGRGDLHIGILLQKLRRQGFQFAVTPPEIIYRIDEKTKEKFQPIQKISFEVQDRFCNLIMDKMNNRKGVYLSSTSIGKDKNKLEFLCSTRALIGLRTQLLNQTQGTAIIKSSFYEYKLYSGSLKKNPKGAIISMMDGVTTPYCLKQLEKFGILFVKPNTQVYNGLVIGENNKQEDIQVNPTKTKQLNNIRTHSHDEKIVLVPAKTMQIQEAICYLRDNQLLEITPKEVRIRKKELDKNGRQKQRRQIKNQVRNVKKN